MLKIEFQSYLNRFAEKVGDTYSSDYFDANVRQSLDSLFNGLFGHNYEQNQLKPSEITQLREAHIHVTELATFAGYNTKYTFPHLSLFDLITDGHDYNIIIDTILKVRQSIVENSDVYITDFFSSAVIKKILFCIFIDYYMFHSKFIGSSAAEIHSKNMYAIALFTPFGFCIQRRPVVRVLSYFVNMFSTASQTNGFKFVISSHDKDAVANIKHLTNTKADAINASENSASMSCTDISTMLKLNYVEFRNQFNNHWFYQSCGRTFTDLAYYILMTNNTYMLTLNQYDNEFDIILNSPYASVFLYPYKSHAMESEESLAAFAPVEVLKFVARFIPLQTLIAKAIKRELSNTTESYGDMDIHMAALLLASRGGLASTNLSLSVIINIKHFKVLILRDFFNVLRNIDDELIVEIIPSITRMRKILNITEGKPSVVVNEILRVIDNVIQHYVHEMDRLDRIVAVINLLRLDLQDNLSLDDLNDIIKVESPVPTI